MEKLFDTAVRNKYRWNYKGQLSIEDLFDLRVTELDIIYKELNRTAKDMQEDSLLDKKTSSNTELNNKIEIVKYIVTSKLEEVDERAAAQKKREQKQLLAEVLNRKENEAIESLSVEEIKIMMKELEV